MKNKIIYVLYKWLPIIFGCHQITKRTFIIKDRKMPICARCTGELFGIFFTLIYSLIFGIIPLSICLILMMPMIIDGTVQFKTKYESNNILRYITGFLFGFSIIEFHIILTIYVIKLGQNI